MKRREQMGAPSRTSDIPLLTYSLVLFVLAVAFAIVIAVPVPSVWRKLIGYLAVIASFGCPTLLLMGLWQAVRYERTWRTMLAIALSFIGTILAWGVTVLYAMGAFGFSRS
jgi:hypothetical protein